MFEREKRYIVFKLADLIPQAHESITMMEALTNSITSACNGKSPLQALVIEADWPEFEPAWDDIQRRMEGRPSLESEFLAEIKRLVTKEEKAYELVAEYDNTGGGNLSECIRELLKTKDEWKEHAGALKAQNLRILRGKFAQICSYCGHEFPADGAQWEHLQAHIQVCPDHPVGKLTAQLHYAKEVLDQLGRLGNGDQFGNSNGNVLAQEALVKLDDMVVREKPAEEPLTCTCDGNHDTLCLLHTF